MDIKAHFPDFLIIGAARCGTSSLHKNLLLHPVVSGPLETKIKGNNKEVHFFDKKFKRGFEWYASCFPEKESKRVLNFESTPNYLYDKMTPHLIKTGIKEMYDSLKFIVMLRNPVDRAWSHYWNWKDKHRWSTKILLDPDHIVVDKGVYHRQLKRWFECFPSYRFMIIKSEDFYSRTAKTINEVFDFLGARRIKIDNPVYYDPKRAHIKDKSQAGYDKIPPKLQDILGKFYRPHNLELEKMLDRKFGW